MCAIDLSVHALLKPLIKESMEQGYIVHNACTDTGRFDELRAEGLTMINIPIERRISPVSNIKSIFKLYKLMKKEKYDIVHVHTPIAAILGRIAAKMARVNQIVYTAHGFYFHEDMSKFQYKLFYFIEKFGAKYLTDWLLLQSHEDYILSVEQNFLRKNKILHLSNGVDIKNNFNPLLMDVVEQNTLKSEYNISTDDVVFMFIGRMVKEKGIFELLEAFKDLSTKYHNIKLLLVGSLLTSERDQESYTKFRELLSDPNVIQLGFRKDIRDLLSISSVFVLPSYREGLPRSIIEAMAMEKPIIATDIRGCREEVWHGENGFLVKKQSVKELADKMEWLIINKEERIRFGRKSREIVENLFDEEKVISKQINLFKDITKSGGMISVEKNA